MSSLDMDGCGLVPPVAADAPEYGGAVDTRGVHRADGNGGGAATDTDAHIPALALDSEWSDDARDCVGDGPHAPHARHSSAWPIAAVPLALAHVRLLFAPPA